MKPDDVPDRLADQPDAAVTRTRRHVLTTLLTLTESQLYAAREGHWERVAKNESRRLELARELFAEPFGVSETGHYQSTLARLAELSTELTRIATDHRSALRSELQTVQRGRQAAAAYSAGELTDR
ncbi:MAG: flagellar protein FliT [Pseudomonadota bacterium]